VAKWLNTTGILNDKLHRFVHVHLDTQEKRQQVYEAWLIYKKFFPDLANLASLIHQKKIRFNMIFGKYDSVITPALGHKFSRILGSTDHLFLIEAGHRLLSEQTMLFIREKNLWPAPLLVKK
jgi:hypothetical protein